MHYALKGIYRPTWTSGVDSWEPVYLPGYLLSRNRSWRNAELSSLKQELKSPSEREREREGRTAFSNVWCMFACLYCRSWLSFQGCCCCWDKHDSQSRLQAQFPWYESVTEKHWGEWNEYPPILLNFSINMKSQHSKSQNGFLGVQIRWINEIFHTPRHPPFKVQFWSHAALFGGGDRSRWWSLMVNNYDDDDNSGGGPCNGDDDEYGGGGGHDDDGCGECWLWWWWWWWWWWCTTTMVVVVIILVVIPHFFGHITLPYWHNHGWNIVCHLTVYISIFGFLLMLSCFFRVSQ